MVRLAADNLRFSPLSLVEGEVGGRSSPGEGASATPLALTGRGPGEGGSGTGILPVTASASPTGGGPGGGSPTAVPTTAVVETPFYTPTILPSPTVPADLYATEAAAMSTPAPTDTPVAMATVPPDPYATQAAEMFATFPPMGTPTAAAFSSPTPWATATTVAFGSPTPTSSFLPHPSASVPSVPSVVETPSPLSHVRTENSQPALARYYYHANRLYSVAALTDAAGTVVERYQYNAYGLCTTFNANYESPLAFSRFGNPFTFTGRELDPETEAMHYRHRTYLLHLARFAQVDPIGYAGGMNLYEYTGSNPIIYLDPLGTEYAESSGMSIRWDDQTNECMLGYTITYHKSWYDYLNPWYSPTPPKKEGMELIGVNKCNCNPQGIKKLIDSGSPDGVILEKQLANANVLLVLNTELFNNATVTRDGMILEAAGVGIIAIKGMVRQIHEAGEAGELIVQGKAFTQAQKNAIREANRIKNGGMLRSDESGVKLVNPQKHVKGVTPPSNEAQIDHVIPRSKGGTNNPENAQVLSREENLRKGAN